MPRVVRPGSAAARRAGRSWRGLWCPGFGGCCRARKEMHRSPT